MHKVKNCGSNLQAYALQEILSQMGHDVEIIDYYYRPLLKKHLFKTLLSFFLDALRGFPKKKQNYRFLKFQEKYYHLSKQSYDKKSIVLTPPAYDIYMSGSDQVWNPRYIGDDTNFMLSFVGESRRKVAYASSFASSEIPDSLISTYSQALSQFERITVREETAIELVKHLTGQEADLVCDPVLLLPLEKWNQLTGNLRLKKEPYILVYILGYMFNPRPNVNLIIEEVHKVLGYNVVYLNGTKEDYFKKDSTIIKDFGPIEFLNWIKNAEFVITDSYHCTVFSELFNCSVWGIVESVYSKDSRIANFLSKIDASDSIITYNTTPKLDVGHLDKYRCDLQKMRTFQNESIRILNDMIR